MKKHWLIPDAYWPTGASGAYVSHEAVCILNPSPHEAHVAMTLLFEDQGKWDGFHIVVGAERTLHVRMDQIADAQGRTLPKDTPYAIVLESKNMELAIQYTRVDTTQNNLTIATTII